MIGAARAHFLGRAALLACAAAAGTIAADRIASTSPGGTPAREAAHASGQPSPSAGAADWSLVGTASAPRPVAPSPASLPMRLRGVVRSESPGAGAGFALIESDTRSGWYRPGDPIDADHRLGAVGRDHVVVAGPLGLRTLGLEATGAATSEAPPRPESAIGARVVPAIERPSRLPAPDAQGRVPEPGADAD